MSAPHRRILALVLASFAVAPALTAQAEQKQPAPPATISSFRYTSVGLSVFQVDIDGVDDEAFGFGLTGAYEFAPQFYALAEIATAEADFPGGGDLELDSYALGAGYYIPIDEATDVYGELALLRVEVDVPGADDDENGWSLEAGVRRWLVEKVEVDASLAWVDLDDSDIAIGLGGQYYFNDQFSVGASFELADDTDTISLDLRYYL